jgi:hypothetical protein
MDDGIDSAAVTSKGDPINAFDSTKPRSGMKLITRPRRTELLLQRNRAKQRNTNDGAFPPEIWKQKEKGQIHMT